MASATNGYNSVFRQDAVNIMRGKSQAPLEIYTRSNTGSPSPKAWAPSGIAVDSLYVYWGNRERGSSNGAVVKGSRVNVGLLSQDRQIKALSKSVDEVHGMVATGTHVFYLSPDGVHGVLKTAAQLVSSAGAGLVARSPAAMDITWDGDNTLYFTDAASGAVYTLPALNILEHNVSKYVDAPGARALAVVGFGGGSSLLHSSAGSAAVCASLPGAVAAWLAVALTVAAAAGTTA
mmetsp:Transcript_41100/g.116238  ORF Transcript_41100/g.116238 Transcript_41100/m.116238 type:complete len:234 (+) Transcript_41100:130-831(+)